MEFLLYTPLSFLASSLIIVLQFLNIGSITFKSALFLLVNVFVVRRKSSTTHSNVFRFSPYTSIKCQWISIGVIFFRYKNWGIGYSLHLAKSTSGSSTANGYHTKTECPTELNPPLFSRERINKQRFRISPDAVCSNAMTLETLFKDYPRTQASLIKIEAMCKQFCRVFLIEGLQNILLYTYLSVLSKWIEKLIFNVQH